MTKAKAKKVPKRALASTLEASTSPPAELLPQQTIARVIKAEGNHLYSVILPRSANLGLTSGPSTEISTTTTTTTLPTVDASRQGPAADHQDGQGLGSEAAMQHLVELTSALRSTVFLRRNGYVLVDCDAELRGGRENKIVGIIVGVVLGGKTEREWRKMAYWPGEFGEIKAWDQSSGSDEDVGPRMPESDEED